MTPVLESILAVLIVVIIVVCVILCIHLVRLLKETTSTIQSIRELTDLTKDEIKPALDSVNNVLKTVDNMTASTNKQLELVKKVLATLLGASYLALTTVKGKGGFVSGLINGFNIFKKKRR